ncbi:hypothetical protein Tco_1486625, partial [Tanacetum coccineum]
EPDEKEFSTSDDGFWLKFESYMRKWKPRSEVRTKGFFNDYWNVKSRKNPSQINQMYRKLETRKEEFGWLGVVEASAGTLYFSLENIDVALE